MSQIDEDEAAVKEARDAAKYLKDLREHPGWLIIKRFAEDQITMRINNYVLRPRQDMASEWEAEYMKGEVAGIKMIVAMIDSELETQEAVKESLDARREQRAAASGLEDANESDAGASRAP